MPAARLELEELADRMRTGFRSWVIHFASCSTVAVPEERIADFLARTGAAIVMGYRNDVDWIESACTDLLLLNRVQNYVDMRRMWKAFRETYGSLVERTGLTAYAA